MSAGKAARTSELSRKTRETTIRLRLDLDGSGSTECDIGDQFLRHMVETLARYSGTDLEMRAEGDIEHHLIEDVAISPRQGVQGGGGGHAREEDRERDGPDGRGARPGHGGSHRQAVRPPRGPGPDVRALPQVVRDGAEGHCAHGGRPRQGPAPHRRGDLQGAGAGVEGGDDPGIDRPSQRNRRSNGGAPDGPREAHHPLPRCEGRGGGERHLFQGPEGRGRPGHPRGGVRAARARTR